MRSNGRAEEAPWPDPHFRTLRFTAIQDDVSVTTISMDASAAGMAGAAEAYRTFVYAEATGVDEWNGRGIVTLSELEALVHHDAVVDALRAGSPVDWFESFVRDRGA